MPRKPRILISAPTAFGVRNVLPSGLARRLTAEAELVILAPRHGLRSDRRGDLDGVEFWDVGDFSEDPWARYLREVLSRLFFRKNKINTWEMIKQYRNRDRARTSQRSARRCLQRLVSAAVQHLNLWALVRRLEEERGRREVPGWLLEALKAKGVAVALSTVIRLPWEWPIFRALQQLGVPSVTHVLSFDNPSSGGYLPLRGFTRSLCWSNAMVDELVDFHQVQRDRTRVTGTPQFDFHIDPDCHWSRTITCSRLQINPDQRYALYCANHRVHTPYEPELLRYLVQISSTDQRFASMQWVVRFHPSDSHERWSEVVRELGGRVSFCQPWRQPDRTRQYMGEVCLDDLALLSNSIRHATCVFGIASTIALDCAVIGTPVVNIAFHPSDRWEEERYYRNAHNTHHYRPINDSGAAPVARDPSEWLRLFEEAVRTPEARRVYQLQLRSRLCGPVDGRAAERIALEVVDVAVMGGLRRRVEAN